LPRPLSDQEILAFIMQVPRTGHIATVRDDGRPHVATIWLTIDGDDIVFVTSSESVKAGNLGRTGYAAIAVDDERPPYSNVAIEGPVSVIDDMHEVHRWVRGIAARYMGDEWARAFSEMDELPDDLVCRLTPARMTGLADMAAA
jgi:PPOX class probable F420-dependent enzyme